MRRRFFNNGVESNYLCIEALEDGLTFSLSRNSLEYSIDDYSNWISQNADEVSQSINIGQRIYIKGDIITASITSGIGRFTITKKCNLSGTPLSLLRRKELLSYCFHNLFQDCTTIVNVSPNFLPATTLDTYCYNGMFSGCTSLQTAPELPATTLDTYCYNGMFSGCTSLQTAPELPATTLALRCYYRMFQECTNLNYIKMLATDISASNCLSYWVGGVASSGTFVKNYAMNDLPTATSNNAYAGIPSGWTVENA